MKVYNYKIVSEVHTNRTVEQYKRALSPFDLKRFLLFDGILTVPFGNEATEENAFLEDIYVSAKLPNSMKLITIRPNTKMGIFTAALLRIRAASRGF